MSSNLPILLVSGSPSAISRSASLLERLARQLRAEGREVQLVYPSDFPASQLIEGNIDHPALAGYRQAVQAAGVVVFGTPVYKATYAGLLKLLIDVVPPDALADKAVVGIATGRTDAHFPLVEESFARLFSAFRGARQLPSLIVSDYQFLAGGGLESGAEVAFQRTFEALLSSSASRPWPRAVNG